MVVKAMEIALNPKLRAPNFSAEKLGRGKIGMEKIGVEQKSGMAAIPGIRWRRQ
ncbi:MAG: hypothetical protein Cons2KO_14300 [Congregibacter sp.]